MFIRCAYLIGKPVAGKEGDLQRALQATLKMYLNFDNIRSIKLLTGRDHEAGAPDIYATLQMCFDSAGDLAAAFEKPFRQEFRAHFAANVMPLFDGIVKHINFDVAEERR